MKSNFKYVPEMQQSEMYLTFDARIGKKQFDVPAVKVADGVIATSELYKKTLVSESGCIAPDAFQRVTLLSRRLTSSSSSTRLTSARASSRTTLLRSL